ncbi:EAL domain-containing protein [Neobacillus citreus]|uniref:histidine kinase n=1 Tax=Neobacillus citreus TaxID=2833578 RepID=A0A942TB65_9BACI|nr:EAL domain-containing protein [Neobacillus citreus]MCH6266988.1 EAL domain-containing protein [Neobacillus citreus]
MVIADESVLLQREMMNALERNEFRLYYQPKVNLETGKIDGVEALTRWEHPEKGLIPPIEFIPIAEKTGFIIPMGEWVLKNACSQNKEWINAGFSPMVMSVNLSVRQLYQPNLVDVVQGILKETELPPEYLELEITESMMMDKDRALDGIKGLRRLGVQISLDDFGTGYSSLHYLHDFPIDKIKIDQSFIRNCTSDLNNATIVKMIIAMAHHLKIKAVAEGIETKDELIFLQKNSCNHGQGYFFSMPLPPEELINCFHLIEQIVSQEGISQEIANQKKMQEALESTRQELRDIMSQQQGMIFKVVKEDGKFIHTQCDGKLMYRMGHKPELVVGKELKDFMPFDIAEQIEKNYQRVWDGEENVTYKGEINGIHFFATLSPILKDGLVVGTIGSCVDFTETKRIKDALEFKNLKFQLITDNILDLVAMLDKNGTVLYASPSHERILGISVKDYEGTSNFELVHIDDIPAIKKEYTNMIKSKTPCQIEFRHKHTQGGWVDIEVKISPVYDEYGEIEYFIAVGRDISNRKRTEEMIRKSEKLSIVGQLASSIAHEIRNPLTSIKGFVQLLQKEVNEPLYLKTILKEIDSIEEITREFLEFAKPHASQIEKLDVTFLLQKVFKLFYSQTIKQNVEIIHEFDSDLPIMFCDSNYMKQVFIHILQNAVEAMPNGGVIKLYAQRYGTDSIKISVIDQGYGISEGRIKKIGEPFYSTKEKCTGLGLMICHKIVQEHGGTINIKSEVNKGTTVEIILPIYHLIVMENLIN